MSKKLTRVMAIVMSIIMCMGMVCPSVFAADGTAVHDKSKTATPLYDNRFTDVTLSVPGEVESLATDIVFVIDKSSSDKFSANYAYDLFEQLMEVHRSTGAKINVGVVIFNYTAHKQIDLVELTEDNYQNLLNSLPSLSGGTNIDAGLTMAKEMLDAHQGVDDSRKHMILISDGLSWGFEIDGIPYTVLTKNGNKNVYDLGTQPYLSLRANGSWNVPSQFDSWSAFWNNVKTLVENDRAAGDKWLFDMSNHRGEDPTKPKPSELLNTEAALAVSVPQSEANQHAMNVERAIYEAWETYTALQAAGYNCNAYYTETDSTKIGYHFMKMLAGSTSMDFNDIKHDILYSVSKGSRVVDYIGYEDAGEESYNFDFVDSADKLVLKVGDSIYTTSKLASANDGATSSYVFTAPGAADATFAVDYFKGNGKDEEHFVWTFGEDVSRFAPVSLTYTLDLVARSEIPGTHENVDTNEKATLYPVDSDGDEGSPEDFEKPKVEYTVDPVRVHVEKIWNDGENRDAKRPEAVTVVLFADNEEIGSAELNADNQWSYTFEGLREYKNGVKINYTVAELDVAGYESALTGSVEDGFTFINSYAPETVAVSGVKTWNDNNNQNGNRPESITIHLLANEKVIKTVTVTEEDGWAWSFTNLYKYKDGVEIVYAIAEAAVQGYESMVNGYNVTNTEIYVPVHTLGSIVVTKNTSGAATPAGATFQLQKMEGNEWINVGEPIAYSAFVENAYTFTKLEEGTYRVIESGAEIEEHHLVTTYSENVVLTKTTAENGDTSVNSGSILVTNTYTDYVHTLGSIVVNKNTTGATTPAGATFQLQKLNGDTWTNVGEAVPFSAFVNNTYTFTDLVEGTYRVIESGATIDGYTLETTYSDEVILTKTTAENGDTSVSIGSYVVTNEYEEDDELIEIPDEDPPLADVPKTGDMILPFAGMAIASGTAAIFFGKSVKKKEDEE